MTFALWVLLAFAGWTVLTLLVGVGLVRWRLILTGSRRLNEFPADVPHGSPRYRRAMRAHANCVENLPLYGAVAVTAALAGMRGGLLDTLPPLFMGARVLQTLTHIGCSETSAAVGVRFAFFFIQLACLIAMGVVIAAA
jgi:uncharacterized MAPEG superfamily protein